MEENMPRTCKVQFDDPNVLHHFCLFITPDEGFWQGGRFKFEIDVPDDYNIVVSLRPSTLPFYYRVHGISESPSSSCCMTHWLFD